MYIAAPYTVTGFACFTGPSATVPSTLTYTPATNVLDSSQYKISLAHLKASASRAASHAANNSSSDLSSGARIGIGVGLGVGVGIVLTAILTYSWRERCARKRQREEEAKRRAEKRAAGAATRSKKSIIPPFRAQDYIRYLAIQYGVAGSSRAAQSSHPMVGYREYDVGSDWQW